MERGVWIVEIGVWSVYGVYEVWRGGVERDVWSVKRGEWSDERGVAAPIRFTEDYP